jgi:hypothetical protein
VAVALFMEFEGVTQEQYDEVMRELGLDREGAAWPSGIISHTAGTGEKGLCVVDVWESRDAFDRFAQERLAAATQKAGVPAPRPLEFQIYNSHYEGR